MTDNGQQYLDDTTGFLRTIQPDHPHIIHQFESMDNIKTSAISEATLSIIAIVLTVGDILYRASVFLFKRIISLVFQLICILMLAAAIILAYLIVMTISTAMGPWFNAHMQ